MVGVNPNDEHSVSGQTLSLWVIHNLESRYLSISVVLKSLSNSIQAPWINLRLVRSDLAVFQILRQLIAELARNPVVSRVFLPIFSLHSISFRV